ncbi:50S ribosomal protein L11 methyltransferase [Aurantiacibacter sp. D1-12]|uniref:50S ribosomal protein L11 methyltransferase n=1 Tax=Aurantiacibacter sp. D1-12 TaxID=2993658 RepID=UPI00237C9952|nr:50S ribosomal protein L11 methyltransferase [Aurantiacibacter sp. D1-12]MDE1468307.1 50S ribosomal protein L11 methyltransferase [Aurantiacibacter sp. D1-12]
MSYKLSVIAPKAKVEAALDARDEDPFWDANIVLTGFEVDPDEPDTWRLDAYLEDAPGNGERRAVLALFGDNPPELIEEELPESDWVTESQRGVEPIRAGRFYVHTPDHAPSDEAGTRNFCIPAAQAFGTGHHETTWGCLVMLDAMAQQGLTPAKVADIGTGTGLLAFGALHLWPQAIATASDIDPVCEPAVIENTERNGIAMGTGTGEMAMLIADGMDDPRLQAAAPFDLLIANILAAPLIEMAPDFAGAVVEGGDILLSGLLATQEDAVRKAYAEVGFGLHQRLTAGDWSILWLRHGIPA